MSLNDRLTAIAAEKSAAKDSIGEAAVKSIIQEWLPRFSCIGGRYTYEPELRRNYKFVPTMHRRAFELDFAWPSLKVGIEIQGGAGSGRHTSRSGYTADCEKRCYAAVLGWTIAEFTTEQVMEDYHSKNPTCARSDNGLHRISVQEFLSLVVAKRLQAYA